MRLLSILRSAMTAMGERCALSGSQSHMRAAACGVTTAVGRRQKRKSGFSSLRVSGMKVPNRDRLPLVYSRATPPPACTKAMPPATPWILGAAKRETPRPAAISAHYSAADPVLRVFQPASSVLATTGTPASRRSTAYQREPPISICQNEHQRLRQVTLFIPPRPPRHTMRRDEEHDCGSRKCRRESMVQRRHYTSTPSRRTPLGSSQSCQRGTPISRKMKGNACAHGGRFFQQTVIVTWA